MKYCLISFLCTLFLFSATSQAQTIYYVKASSGSDTNTGTSWASPFKNLTKALAAANSSSAAEVQIWIAGGVYTPVDGISSLPTDTRDTSFTFYRGSGVGKALKIYGGFTGTETNISARDTVHPTYLDGLSNGKSSYHVVIIAGLAATADSVIIDGVTIRNGSASGRSTKTYNGTSVIQYGGGGIYIANNATNKVVVRNCAITLDSAVGADSVTATGEGGSGYGGGAYLKSTQCQFINCNISFNITKGGTGGKYIYGGLSATHGGNGYGGGMYMDSAIVTMNKCSFNANQVFLGMGHGYRWGNGIQSYGGGLYISNCSPTLTHCLFSNNIANGGTEGQDDNQYESCTPYGGGICNYNASPNIGNCIFQYNQAYLGQYMSCGGGMANLSSSPYVYNCRFTSNLATDSLNLGFLSGAAMSLGGGVYNASSLPNFVNDTFSDNRVMATVGRPAGGGIYNTSSSCSITNCIITHNQSRAMVGDGVPYDAHYGGGGIVNEACSPLITNCTISFNHSNNAGGGILNFSGANAIFTNCNIEQNVVDQGFNPADDYREGGGCGAGIYNGLSAPTFINCKINGNYSTARVCAGGAAYNISSAPVFIKCSITNNRSGQGGGFFNDASIVTIDTCTFFRDSSVNSGGFLLIGSGVLRSINGSCGGAVFQIDGSLNTNRCQFNKNYAATAGGAIYVSSSRSSFVSSDNVYIYNKTHDNSFGRSGIGGGAICFNSDSSVADTLINNLFAYNTSGGNGGALLMGGSAYFICNNTFFADTANDSGGAFRYEGAGSAKVANNIFYNCKGSGSTKDTSTLGQTAIFQNNLYSNTNPLFVNINNLIGPDSIWATADDGLALQRCSAGINKGSNAFSVPGIRTDLACGNRINGNVIDIGAYESSYAGIISGPNSVCLGSVNGMTDTVSGGTWNSSDTAIARVGATGIVTAVAPGTATITYAVSLGCLKDTATLTLNVVTPASSISGVNSVCKGAAVTLTDSTASGAWSSSNPSVATVASSGMVAGLAQGTAEIKYTVTNQCGITSATKLVTVYQQASAIHGADSLCAGSKLTFTDSTSGGKWISSDTSVATINNAGYLNALAVGTSTISYTVSNVCGVTTSSRSIKVQRPASAIAGPDTISICSGSMVTLSDSVTNGTWSSSNPMVATVSAAGQVKGLAQGTAEIKYTITNQCGTTSATKVVTIYQKASTILSADSLCAGAKLTLTDSTSGGKWISSDTSVATINNAGYLNALAVGTSTISYTVSNVCGVTISSRSIKVQRPASVIAGPDTISICAGATVTLSDSVTNGTWSSSNPIVATVSAAGLVKGLVQGIAEIKYMVTNQCGTTSATKLVIVYQQASAIHGTDSLCAGSKLTFTDSTAGGKWISSDTSVATINNAGYLNALAVGTSTISYTVSNVCGVTTSSRSIKIQRPASAIAGPDTISICAGATVTLSDSVTNGTWNSSNSTVATISGAGQVTGLAQGTTEIKYTVTNQCGTTSATKLVIVYQQAATIQGADSLCAGSKLTFTDSTAGGKWISSDTSVATINNAGYLNALSVGTSTISYTVSNVCGVTTNSRSIKVQRPASVIAGPDTLCSEAIITLSDSTIGGFWTSSKPSVATINDKGILNYVSQGTTTVSYSVTNACGITSASRIITTERPASPIIGALTVCAGHVINLGDSVLNGLWRTSDTGIAIVDTVGRVTGISQGSAGIIYTVNNSCGTSQAKATVIVQRAASLITGPDTVCEGKSITLTDSVINGVWSSSNPGVASVTNGIVTGIGAGISTINYSVSNTCGTSSRDHKIIVLSKTKCDSIAGVNTITTISNITVYPNPANYVINVDAPFAVNIILTGADGKLYRKIQHVDKIDIKMLPDGIYLLGIYDTNWNRIKIEEIIKKQ